MNARGRGAGSPTGTWAASLTTRVTLQVDANAHGGGVLHSLLLFAQTGHKPGTGAGLSNRGRVRFTRSSSAAAINNDAVHALLAVRVLYSFDGR